MNIETVKEGSQSLLSQESPRSPSFTDLMANRDAIYKEDGVLDMFKLEEKLFINATDREYYLYGQKKILRTTKLSSMIFIEVIQLNNQSHRNHGDSYNSFETASITRHEDNFRELQKAVNIWKRLNNR